MSADHDATNPAEAVWLATMAPLPADTVRVIKTDEGVVSVTFGVTTGPVVVPVVSLVLPTTDGASIGASLLNLSRRKKRG